MMYGKHCSLLLLLDRSDRFGDALAGPAIHACDDGDAGEAESGRLAHVQPDL